MFAGNGFIMTVLLYWLSIFAAVAAYPVMAGIVFVTIMAVVIATVWHGGWLWGFGILTLFGLALGPALLLTPVILAIKGLAATAPTPTPSVEPRPVLLEPRAPR